MGVSRTFLPLENYIKRQTDKSVFIKNVHLFERFVKKIHYIRPCLKNESQTKSILDFNGQYLNGINFKYEYLPLHLIGMHGSTQSTHCVAS